MIIHASPLQGFSDFRFRNAYQKYFGGIDVFYCPYIRLDAEKEISRKYRLDVEPSNNSGLKVVPQLMCNNAEDFLSLSQYLQRLGYNEVNWNLGCPYPMVAKKKLGSGLIHDHQLIENILDQFFSRSEIKVSVKTRLGYDSADEIRELLPVLNKFPLLNIIIHPRIGKQLYKGNINTDAFQYCLDNTDHVICYNGDIHSHASFEFLRNRFSSVDNWALGRGLLLNPFLPAQMLEPEQQTDYRIFADFHEELFLSNANALSGSSHILQKMIPYWEYFSMLFSDAGKLIKKIRKSKSVEQYRNAVSELFLRSDD